MSDHLRILMIDDSDRKLQSVATELQKFPDVQLRHTFTSEEAEEAKGGGTGML